MARLAPALKGLKINNDDALGIGSYGKVVRAKLGKCPCAAKLLHDTMFQFNDPGLQNLVIKFKEECDLLSNIEHPNVVKYMGTTHDPRTGRPVLLMELMHQSLKELLESSAEPLSYYHQFCVSHDVASALVYLHSRSVIHRDLSSNNVLLSAEGTAKVTDFGMSKLIEMHPKATPLTLCPGTLAYMPPEALMTPPQYSDKLDCFSFGVLEVQIATRQFPDPGNANKYVEDPNYPTGIFVPIPEIERRRKHIDLIESDHPLLSLALECLNDRESERPSAQVICTQLASLREEEELKEEQKKRELALKKEQEERKRQEHIKMEEEERLKKKQLEEEARKEEKQRQKEEKEEQRLKKKQLEEAQKEEKRRQKEEERLKKQQLEEAQKEEKRRQKEEKEERKRVKAVEKEAAKAAKQSYESGVSLSLKLPPFLTKRKPRRYIEDGFDLDLTYIKPNIVAMAFPCEKLEGIFRNNILDVVRFFDIKHPDHYKVYNLCSERSYDPERFHGRVATYPFDEDEAPLFELIRPFCDDMDQWLKEDCRNIAVVHCDDGLGRTGTMVCAYLLHDKLFDWAKDTLQFYAEARTENAKALTIPSQRRYVQYYGHLIRNSLLYTQKTVVLKAVRMEGIPHFSRSGCAPRFKVCLIKTTIYTSEIYENIRATDNFVEFSLPEPVPLCGDVNIKFYHRRKLMFKFWFNTFFVDMHVIHQQARYLQESTGRGKTSLADASGSYTVQPECKVLNLYQEELDVANEDSKHFSPGFQVHLVLSEVNSEQMLDVSDVQLDSSCTDDTSDEDLSDTDEVDEWQTRDI